MNRNLKRDPALQVLLDKQEIYEVLMRYCRGVDRCDEQLLRSVYHPDAMDDHGLYKGTASGFVEWVIKTHRLMKRKFHSVANVLIEVDGDVAFSEAYWTAYIRSGPEGQETDLISTGRYIDCFERRNGAWKIAHRQLVFDFTHRQPAGADLTPERTPGRHAPDDLINRVLAGR